MNGPDYAKEYYENIRRILDDAAGDKSLSTEDYANLCSEVSDDAQTRYDAAQEDLQSQLEETEDE